MKTFLRSKQIKTFSCNRSSKFLASELAPVSLSSPQYFTRDINSFINPRHCPRLRRKTAIDVSFQQNFKPVYNCFRKQPSLLVLFFRCLVKCTNVENARITHLIHRKINNSDRNVHKNLCHRCLVAQMCLQCSTRLMRNLQY